MFSVLLFLANWASGRINFWRCNVILTSQKLKTKYFRNSFGADGKARVWFTFGPQVP